MSPKGLLSRYEVGERKFPNAELPGVNLSGANLSGINLSGANLSGINLSGALLDEADLRHANLSSANLTSANLSAAHLFRANLSRADLSEGDLTGTNLVGADLTDAKIVGVDLSEANLAGANFTRANLFGSSLSEARLYNTNFTDADLSEVDLIGALLYRTQFHSARCDSIRIGHASLLKVDLGQLCAATPPVEHVGPSYVDHTTVLCSVRAPGLNRFLARAGMPEIFVEYMIDCALSLKTDMFKMLQSTFISYGAPDEPFARKLYEALHRNGVTTFFFPEHAEPGEKLHRTMRKGVNEHDRVILICSRYSLDRKGVLNELEEILTREARDGGASYLIPIRLDDYVFTRWKPPNSDVAQAVRDRVVADFEGANEDEAKFQAGLQKLIRVLKKKTVEAADAGKG
ncbi:toll/interleukin-1 receptor domain-containing protein [Sorangium sp. So ce327]|uniref:toll/interleukin-1 receptor domain-containing protein n=1 Tax=Sorangium sp. So ce327 TaxID=3133301 RepID=UPI003F5F7F33